MKKIFWVGLWALILWALAAAPAAAAEGDRPVVEYEGVRLGGAAIVFDDGLFLPLRAVAESAGYTVHWSDADRRITLRRPGWEIVLTLDNQKATAGGHEFYLPGGCKLVEGRTYVPRDFIDENLGLQVVWDKSKGLVSVASVKTNEVTVKTKKISLETPKLLLNIQYPRIEGLADPDIQEKINSIFEKAALASKGQGMKNGNDLPEESLSRHIKAETYFDYRVRYNQNNIFSVVFQDYQYAGGAHGLTPQTSYTFNLQTGDLYNLADLFKENEDYVSPISREVKRQLAEKGITVLLNPFDAIKADQDFYITGEGLVVYFQQYELLPYAYGIPEFTIAYSSLAGMLKDDMAGVLFN